MTDAPEVDWLPLLDSLKTRYPTGVPRRLLVPKPAAAKLSAPRLVIVLGESLDDEGEVLLYAAIEKGLGLPRDGVRSITIDRLAACLGEEGLEPVLILGTSIEDGLRGTALDGIQMSEVRTLGNRIVLRTLHPNAVARDASLKRPLWEDLKKIQSSLHG